MTGVEPLADPLPTVKDLDINLKRLPGEENLQKATKIQRLSHQRSAARPAAAYWPGTSDIPRVGAAFGDAGDSVANQPDSQKAGESDSIFEKSSQPLSRSKE